MTQQDRRSGARWLAGIAAVALTLTLAGGWHAHSAAAQGPAFSLTPAQQTVALASGTAQVQVHIDGVSDMASFQFLLRYDAGVLKDPVVTESPFLGTSGRTPACLWAIVDKLENGAGTVQFGCATSGQGGGVSGSGLLATVTFQLAGGASTTIGLEKLSASDPLNNSVCDPGCGSTGGSITVTGGSVDKQQGIVPEPTLPPLDSAPGPVSAAKTSEAAAQNPAAAGATPVAVAGAGGSPAPVYDANGNVLAGAPAGSGQAPLAGAAASSNGATGASAGGAANVGRFGSGPVQHRQQNGALAWWLALAGVVLVSASVVVRPRR